MLFDRKPDPRSDNRWIDNRLLFVRDCYKEGLLKLTHIGGTENPADGLTKPLDATSHREFCRMIRLIKQA
ncbi:hypothetical protein BO79DRAFT_280054 [Aspergillus costaricaensis CBS 115574]|uniref:Uncharacterized protein n=1 Tax=Aspergillus costaricaensis CBS 115574 TaxID=1448317 RepID=A0ACD1HXT0_9EURO|nr:hypothetical protein BO79DRAFT_280054 [Aspergillus costaricaensis CBS 115574]RAK82874.1 hypothetical protein BO79DRAFT_280054 [Aspergillus costaricaensis CBS 115574]